jgi:predicted nucleic acid-binding protein
MDILQDMLHNILMMHSNIVKIVTYQLHFQITN